MKDWEVEKRKQGSQFFKEIWQWGEGERMIQADWGGGGGGRSKEESPNMFYAEKKAAVERETEENTSEGE